MKDFNELIQTIKAVHDRLLASTTSAINQALTIRNWLIGQHIVEFEQHGKDRAEYGEKLLVKIAGSLPEKGFSVTNLKLYRQFYTTYPQIGQTVSDQLNINLESDLSDSTRQLLIRQTPTDLLISDGVSPYKMLQSLSFSHLVELLKIEETQKRLFYEIECIKGTWSVRELKRQINSLYYERSGISKSPKKLSVKTIAGTTPEPRTNLVKDIYTFEFLGLPLKDAVEESELESALITHLREFMLEMGNGFCLEARQKRILIGDEYYFIDLVFYHRILKCHVLVELKVDAFNHANAGQLNTYINYYKQEIKQAGDNDPIGILLVTDKNHALVQYATAGMDQNLFVGKYLLELPAATELEDFINKELKIL